MKKILLIGLLAMALLSNCKSSVKTEIEGTINVNYNELKQEIDGFGGSNAWMRLPGSGSISKELVTLLFSKKDGVGFTILRNRLPFRERLSEDDDPGLNDSFIVRKSDNTYNYTENADGIKTFALNWNSWDISSTRTLIKNILDLGTEGPEKLTIMSSPWTAPNNRVTRWKEDVAGVNPNLDYTVNWSKPDLWGRLRRDKYIDYADLLADYALNFESMMGAPLSVLSVQNEPNWKTEYESTYWNGADIRDFIKTIAERFPLKGIALGESGLGIMAPEFENFNVNFNEMIKPSLDDAQAQKVLTHIALHQYNAPGDVSVRAGALPFPEINASGKRFWQTEVSGSGAHLPPDTGIQNAIFYARMVHFDMTLSEVNAYLFWWLWTNNDSNPNFPGSLVNAGNDKLTIALRLYAIGQYSRFIRPGWQRIGSETSPSRGIYSSAYKNPQGKEIAIVIINDRITASAVTIDLKDADFNNLEIYRTSANEKLKFVGKQKTSNSSAEVTLAPFSITTLYGTVK